MSMMNNEKNSLEYFKAGGLELAFCDKAGTLCGLTVEGNKPFIWTDECCSVKVRDDLLRKTFDERDVTNVSCVMSDSGLEICKEYSGAPWKLIEYFRIEADEIRWNARVELPDGEFRSCAISFIIPWPKDPTLRYRMKVWCPRAGMPTGLCNLSDTLFEHGEITSGITFPAIATYLPKNEAGLLLAVPFDFKTPRAGFNVGLRTPGLEAKFDWLALSQDKPAEASLIFRSIGGDWRPAMGWIVNRYPEFFEPRCERASELWGGTVAGNTILPIEEAEACAQLGLSWYEVHRHFYAYGNYHPEGIDEWQSGETLAYDKYVKLGKVTVEAIRRTIGNLHKVNAAAMMYIQAGGDGDVKLLSKEILAEKVLDRLGQTIPCWQGTIQINGDVKNVFGKDISRQIDGMVERYPEMDGVFLDQACYNFADFAHNDGITAIDNHPCYMTGFVYGPHLEHLSKLLHPKKAIIANGPHSIDIMKYADAFILEADEWLAEQLQYYGPCKPVFFLTARTKNTKEDIERMFQLCLVYATGFTSYAHFLPFKELYDLYVPLLRKIYGRKWVFEPDPLSLPNGFKGNIFRSSEGNILITAVNARCRYTDLGDSVIFKVRTSDIEKIKTVIMHSLGGLNQHIDYVLDENNIKFEISARTVAAVIEVVINEN